MKKLFSQIQTLTGATRRELLIVLLLFVGLLIGMFWRNISTPELEIRAGEKQSPDEIERIIDSVARAEQSTYSGTAPSGEPVPELAEADTIVQRAFGRKAAAQKIQSGTINLNTASKQDLMRLPGVGEATAEKILLFRTIQRFRHIEDVMQVSGIGTKKFMAMREFLSVQ